MTKRKVTKKDDPVEKKSFWTTLPGILTAVAALITAIAGLVAALNSTHGLFSSKATPSSIPPTYTVSPVVMATETLTPAPPPTFTTELILLSEDKPNPDIEQVEFEFEQGILPAETIQDFIRLSRIAYGELGPDGAGFNIQLILHNTSNSPLLLDLSGRFFSLVDDQGQAAELVYFCCTSKGQILPAGQERTVQLFFRSPPGWSGKSISANYIFIRVNGLLPVIRIAWKMHTLAVAS